jgi:hypothetical protein
MIAVDVRLAIGRHSDGTNPFDAGRVGWHKLPQRVLPPVVKSSR